MEWGGDLSAPNPFPYQARFEIWREHWLERVVKLHLYLPRPLAPPACQGQSTSPTFLALGMLTQRGLSSAQGGSQAASLLTFNGLRNQLSARSLNCLCLFSACRSLPRSPSLSPSPLPPPLPLAFPAHPPSPRLPSLLSPTCWPGSACSAA